MRQFCPDYGVLPTVPQCSDDGCPRAAHARGYCPKHYNQLRRSGELPTIRRRAGGGRPLRWIKEFVSYGGGDCLPWPFMRGARGYAVLKGPTARTLSASRIMCIEAHGDPPSPRHEAAHSCGNGHLACMNRNHLRWATTKENQQDKVDHGRSAKGERNASAKLTEEDVREIRRRIAAGETQTSVARHFGISQSQVWAIKERRSWGCVRDR